MKPASLHLLCGIAAAAAFACASAPGTTAPFTAPGAARPPPQPNARLEPPAPLTHAARGLSFTIHPGDAVIAIDGKSYGKVCDLAQGFVPLEPGFHQVRLERAGFVTWRGEVAVRVGIEPIQVKLAEAP